MLGLGTVYRSRDTGQPTTGTKHSCTVAAAVVVRLVVPGRRGRRRVLLLAPLPQPPAASTLAITIRVTRAADGGVLNGMAAKAGLRTSLTTTSRWRCRARHR
jgi:hypothetical protein